MFKEKERVTIEELHVATWFIERICSMRARLPPIVIIIALNIHSSPLTLPRHVWLQSDQSFHHGCIISCSNSLFFHGFFD